MPTELREQNKNSADLNVRIVYARQCESIFGRKICTPEIRLRAYLHLSSFLTGQLSSGITAATGALAAAAAAGGVTLPSSAIIALVGGLIAIGVNTAKNPDGSLDLMIGPLGVLIGPLGVPVPLPPPLVAIMLNSL